MIAYIARLSALFSRVSKKRRLQKFSAGAIGSGLDLAALQSKNDRPTPIRPTIITATVLKKVHRR